MATYPFVPIVNSLGHNEKHRNQQLTDYGAKIGEKETMSAELVNMVKCWSNVGKT